MKLKLSKNYSWNNLRDPENQNLKIWAYTVRQPVIINYGLGRQINHSFSLIIQKYIPGPVY